ncbi:N-acetylmuramoyl-L-alanine amidase [Bacillus sp. DNRA2]|uniref:N-acetylmuramoyl-L-alanine amidase n=1 Tax=Bacillus sp. DNRA2 TaxID=2723053 RepID=UPI00145F0295|nr:N-acetylmuramoyl-L-alanine amidase [Bacillus sp. DNRA2]NMD70133.1 N-acetylmuramoyl-L-alanine amidase [Bacillus sp. DNRA2]
MVKIFIDPGHGGSDSGAVGNGLQEKNLTLQIASGVRHILENEYVGVSVLMSRTGDQTVSLSQRTNAANSWGADYYLSIHINSGGGTGFESYIYPGVGAPTTTYRNAIHDEVLKVVNFVDRGKKSADFHVLRESNMDAVLTENGFIDNINDATKLRSASFIDALARGHANGLARAFNLQKKPAPAPAPSPNPSVLYKVQIGAFKVKENADKLAGDARSKGFDAVVLLRDGLYKVQIGAFKDKANADALVMRAKNAGFSAFVVAE